MKKTIIRYFNLFLFILICSWSLFAQQKGIITATNVSAKPGEGKVTITYDLQGSVDSIYHVSIYLIKAQRDDKKIKLKNLTGAVGEGKLAGINRTITWLYQKDIDEQIVGSDILEQDIRFYIEAEYEIILPETSSSNLWYYIGGAAVLAGGVAAILLSSSSKNEESVFPKPPNKPE